MTDQARSLSNKLKEAGKHSFIYGIGSVAQSAATLVLLPILTGALGSESFGAYSLILMVSTVTSAIFYLGMNSALPRSYFDYDNESDRQAVFTTAFVILLLGTLTQILIGWFGGSGISVLIFDSTDYGQAIFWSMLAGALTSICGLFYTYLRILRNSITTIVYSLFGFVGSVGITLLLLDRFPGDISTPFFAMSIAQAAIILCFLLSHGGHALGLKIMASEVKNLLAFGIASIFASFGGVLLEWLDRLIVEHYLTLADVGNYSAVYRVGSLINVVLILPFTQIWTPMMMEYRSHSDIKELFSKILIYYLIAGSLIISFAAVFAKEILTFLIRSGSPELYVPLFIIVMLAILLFGLTNIVVAGFFYERKVPYLAYCYYLLVAVKVTLSVYLIPRLGIVGAAYSTLIVYLLLPSLVYLWARRYFSFPIDWPKIFINFAILLIPIAFGLGYFGMDTSALALKVMVLVLACALIFSLVLDRAERQAMAGMLARQ